jgi:hypothetical protein
MEQPPFTTPAALQQAANNYKQLVTAACSKRKIAVASASTNLAFQLVGGSILKATVTVRIPDAYYTWHTGVFESDPQTIDVSFGLASEEDLIAARKIATRTQAGQIDDLLKLLRKAKAEQPAAPLPAEKSIKPKARNKFITIQRGDDGKMSGAFVMET